LLPVLHFHFIENEHVFLNDEIHNIYKKMDENFGVAILSYERLNDNQMFIDLLDVVYDNFERYYERNFGFDFNEYGEVSEESYMKCNKELSVQHRDILESLAKDIQKSFVHHKYFFILEDNVVYEEPKSNFVFEEAYHWTFLNKPVLGVW
jgi:hypothetical protein